MDTDSFKRPLMISLAVMLVLVVGSWLLDITITITVCMLAIAWQVVRLLYSYAFRIGYEYDSEKGKWEAFD